MFSRFKQWRVADDGRARFRVNLFSPRVPQLTAGLAIALGLGALLCVSGAWWTLLSHSPAPLRHQLWYGLAGIAWLVLAAALLLFRRIRPLVLGLQRARDRLEAILDNVPAGVLTFDADGRILIANRAAQEMFGYPSLVDRNVAELMPANAGQLLRGDGYSFQAASTHRDGSALAIEAVANCFMLGEQSNRIAIVQDVRERLAMESALRQREAGLAHAQRLAHIGSWERDVVSGDYSWSDETFRIFGMAQGSRALNHEEVTAMVHPDDRALKLRKEQETGAGLCDYDVVFRVLLPGGVIKVIHSRAAAEFGPDGKPLRFRGTIQDITEKVWADEKLRKREEEYRALVENSPDVVLRFDRELRCVYVNPALSHAYGLRTLVAWGRVLDPRAAPHAAWLEALNKALWAGHTGSFEVCVEEGGAQYHYQVQVVPEFRQGGKVATAVATARDISSIRHGEAVLRESEQRLSGIAANTPGAVFQWVSGPQDSMGFTYISEGVAQLFGETPAAVLRDPSLLAMHLPGSERERIRASLAHLGETLDTLNWEGRARAGDGREIWINCRATPRRKEGATIWDGVMLDITDSKRNEQQLTESRRLLRELAAHREQVREEERRKVAREVHDELGQALTALRLDVGMLRLQGGPHSPAMLERIAAIKAAVDGTIGIVRNVTSALRPAALDLGLAAALEWQVADFGRRTGIVCRLRAQETGAALDDGQATALFRIVQESLTNVIKHAQANEVEVALDAGADGVRLRVRDNGRGFQAQVQPLPGKFGLMGMRERVLMLGGSLDIQSKYGEGACIEVRLPPTNEQGAHAHAS